MISDTDYASMILSLDINDHTKELYLWLLGYHKSNPEFDYMLYDGVSDIYDDNRVFDQFYYCLSEVSVNGNKIEDDMTCWGVKCSYTSKVMFFNDSRSDTYNNSMGVDHLGVSSFEDIKQLSGKITFFDNQGRMISEDTFDVSMDFKAPEDNWELDFGDLFGI